MKRALWNGLAACIAILALSASSAALAAKKKTPTPASEASSPSTAADKAAKTEKVNLNTADEKAIAGAKGVGEKLAQELVKNRPYKTWEEVSKVKGVGSGKKLESLKKVLKLSEGVGAAAKVEPTAEKKETKEKKSRSSSKGGETQAVGAGAGAASGATGTAAGPGIGSPASATPSTSKKSSSSSTSSSSSAKLAPGTKININTATKEELDALPEIGPVKAQAIVDYREANGRFSAPEDVMKVTGIKEGTYAKIKDYIVVK